MSRSGLTNAATAGGAFGADDVSYALSVTASQHATVVMTNSGTSYRVSNTGTVTVFISLRGQFATMPTLTPPVDGTPGNCLPVLAGESRVFTGPPNAQIAAIGSAAGPSVVYVTPGEGV